MRNYFLRFVEFVIVYIGVFFFTTAVFLIVVLYGFQLTTIYLEADVHIFSDLSYFNKKDNLFFLSPEKYRNEIQRLYPAVKEVAINKNYPRSLYIKVVERNPLATAYFEGKTIYIDTKGVVLPPLSRFSSENLARIECPLTINNNRIANQDILEALRILDAINTNHLATVATLFCHESGKMSLFTNATEIIFSSGQDPQKVVASLQFLIKQFTINASWPKEIDLRFDKTVLIP